MKIVAVKKGTVDGHEVNEQFKLDNGEIIDVETAYQYAKDGKLEGVVAADREGTKYVRGINDGDDNNNLDTLPTF
jgi:hypothetical protein